MYKILRIIISIIILLVPFSVYAGQGDISVGDVNLSSLNWGKQFANIELENNTEYIKYIITYTDLSFEGVYTNPESRAKKIYLLEPLQKITLTPEIFIPGNYGTVTIKLEIYDVVDTLDVLLPSQKFYEQPFIIKFHPSDEIFPYLQEKITFPPRVNVHPSFNNEFARLLFTLLAEGKTVEEIAALNECDVEFVKTQIAVFVQKGYIIADKGSYKLNFPYISSKEAEDGRKIADIASDKLAALMKENIGGYYDVVDSLITAKAYPNDTNDFISGATLLRKPTPVVSTFVLWFELGREFITRSAPLLLYNGTDICNAGILQYMYMVNGGNYLNGSHFFTLFYGEDTYSLMFSEDPLQIVCKENFHLSRPQKSGIWNYNSNKFPEFYVIDSSKIRPFISLMAKGSDEILKEAYDGLKKNSFAHGHDKVYIGHRYWMWNLIATLTLEKLYKNNTLEKRDINFYRFDKIKGYN